MLFLYQIKGKNDAGGWLWPPLWTDIIEASNKLEAKKVVEEIHGKVFPERVLRKDRLNDFLMVLKEIKEDDFHTRSLMEVKLCKYCGKQFKVIEKYCMGNEGGGRDYCSSACAQYMKSEQLPPFAPGNNQPAVIYKITNKITGKHYIGKTNQVFTLRWYQHFFQPGNNKFHEAIKNSKLTDWTFEIIEVVDLPAIETIDNALEFVLKREMYWIGVYNSLNNGYNTTPSLVEEIKMPEFDFKF